MTVLAGQTGDHTGGQNMMSGVPVLDRTPNRLPVGSVRSGGSPSRSREGHRASPAHRRRRPSTWAGSGTARAARQRAFGSRERPGEGRASATTPAAAGAGSRGAACGNALSSNPERDFGDCRGEFGPGARFGGCHDSNQDVTRRHRGGVHNKGLAEPTTNGVSLHRVPGGRRNGIRDAKAGVVGTGRPRGPRHVEWAGPGANTRPREGAEAARAMHAAQPARWR